MGTSMKYFFRILLGAFLLPACREASPPISGADSSAKTSTSAADIAPSFAWDLDDIRKRDTLIVLAPYNSTSYFLYRGEAMGYEYELLKDFAKDAGVELRVVLVQDRDSMFNMLRAGKGDIAAARLIPLPQDSGRVAYTRELYRSEPVVVQQKQPVTKAIASLPDAVDTILKAGPAERSPTLAARVRLISRPADLVAKRVDLPKQSPYVQTLMELEDSVTGDIHVVELDASDDKLIREVSKGNIRYTVAEGNVAELQQAYYKNLHVRPVIGAARKVAWAVRPNAPVLLGELNRWIGDEKTGSLFNRLYNKYFTDRRGYEERVQSRYLTSETGTLSPYDKLLKQHAGALGWDWRLLGSQMYQESRFKPNARSWAGATGLLQLMPATGRQFGVRNPNDPEQNVAGAVKFLQWLTRYWTPRIPDPQERLKFILASYNTGAGHVEDAQRLAEANKDNPKKWSDVSYWLLQKSKREVYTQPMVKYGFSRGIEPVTYVAIILDRFDHYKQFVVDRVAPDEGG
jgi:membrane-bound lytic murein transglycosylase F